ncbi:MAG: gamma-glutamyl-gamma-aminobutyrate hydrolase family protein, partial [Bdellovibrionales bacterium]|nr:gamma-glutamyl-gamma-aminobutyrate hydrolase family protein [Bdellovibrionales bacterium]
IGQVFGGAVISAPLLMHGKVSEIQHDEKTIFTGLPNPLKVMRYHSLTVEAHTLPRELEISSHSPDGTIMSLRHRSYAVEGVQFHPESFACEGGLEIIHNFLKGVGH